MSAEPVASRIELRLFVLLAFDGARLAPAWPLGEKVKVEGRMQKGRAKPPKATLKPPQSLLLGNRCDPKATLKPPQSATKATPKPYQSLGKARGRTPLSQR